MGTVMMVQDHPFMMFLFVWVVFLFCVFKDSEAMEDLEDDGTFFMSFFSSFVGFGAVGMMIICSPKVADYGHVAK